MHQRPAGATVAVGERVDGLELGVGDGGLGEGRVDVVVDVGDEVVEEPGDLVGWRGDEAGATRVVGTATDPVLDLADNSTELWGRRAVHEGAVDAGDHRG